MRDCLIKFFHSRRANDRVIRAPILRVDFHTFISTFRMWYNIYVDDIRMQIFARLFEMHNVDVFNGDFFAFAPLESQWRVRYDLFWSRKFSYLFYFCIKRWIMTRSFDVLIHIGIFVSRAIIQTLEGPSCGPI